ncbi:uncharacterized protein LOC124145915 [Haliotis rufescens]|uniref:uncharacterized protein LOC124145915 n=1 Tax=Haliotis rufescens TaxID=6454 RepID=UPI00201ED78A|nr:uncharacterized protein LOC124145915 [Haliotis rufescens]
MESRWNCSYESAFHGDRENGGSSVAEAEVHVVPDVIDDNACYHYSFRRANYIDRQATHVTTLIIASVLDKTASADTAVPHVEAMPIQPADVHQPALLPELYKLGRTPVKTQVMERMAKHFPDQAQFLVNGFKYGFKLGYDGTVIVIGAFLHDIGHLVGQEQQLPKMVTDDVNLGAVNHDTVGARFLQDLGFPEIVCDLVGGHVNAKRYLVWKYPDYYEKLTPASRKTLEHQGGPMDSEEATAFETSPLCEIILRMRTWDERVKDAETKMDSIDKFKNICMDVLKGRD